MSKLIEILTSKDPSIRDVALDSICSELSLQELIKECDNLEKFRHSTLSLYEKVRALFFLYALYRFYIPKQKEIKLMGHIPYDGYLNILNRRFEEAIEIFKNAQNKSGLTDGLASCLAEAYHSLGFQTLSDQVRKSVRLVKGNQWMFRTGHPADLPLRLRSELYKGYEEQSHFPVLHESTPVRMDLSHSGWSDIFFLGMDYPEGAKVLNISVDLSIHSESENNNPKPPIDCYLRVIDKPVLRLVSIDLETSAEIKTINELFDFSKDYLGLLKAGVIASGIVPPGMDGAENSISELFSKLIKPGFGLELVTHVNGIPKGSRLAVSTNLLASIIAICMRATSQTKSLTGNLNERERRLVAARSILGEWLGGSGGGWQDSGGVWDGIKIIEGNENTEGDPEFGISNGSLLPSHHILGYDEVSEETRKKLQNSLVVVHGGMAQDVGPILEMVTEKYLLRSPDEWEGRKKALEIFDEIVNNLKAGDISKIGELTQENFEGPIQTIIPWASNLFTEMIIKKVEKEFGNDFYGFWMLGGMSGGGMGFMFEPSKRDFAKKRLHQIMKETKSYLQNAVPFAIEPVVYDFKINENGTTAFLHNNKTVLMPSDYYSLVVPELLKRERSKLTKSEREELDMFGSESRNNPLQSKVINSLFDRLLPDKITSNANQSLKELLIANGFDNVIHEQIRSDIKSGRIGLAQNRLPISTKITDVTDEHVLNSIENLPQEYNEIGSTSIRNGEVGIITLAGGVGSRWTKGAGVVKALNPFSKFLGRHRSFIEVHLAKSRKTSHDFGYNLPHIFTTSYLTNLPISDYLAGEKNFGYEGEVYVSPGMFVGQRLIPTKRDLQFMGEELTQQILDDQEQKVLESTRKALLGWVENMGEASDYIDNIPLQCMHPMGHWYEFVNLLKNGTLLNVLNANPNLKYFLIHNIDTLGTNIDASLLGYHIKSGSSYSAEVINRRVEDSGGGLAMINGQVRLIEGMALPHENIEFNLSYYNTASNWIDIDRILEVFHLTRSDLNNTEKVIERIRELSQRMPTYITIKDVKKRWGRGQEDIYPLMQFEKLWGDMTSLSELKSSYILVPRERGQQLKEPAQLDGWLRDGSADYVNSLCKWD